MAKSQNLKRWWTGKRGAEEVAENRASPIRINIVNITTISTDVRRPMFLVVILLTSLVSPWGISGQRLRNVEGSATGKTGPAALSQTASNFSTFHHRADAQRVQRVHGKVGANIVPFTVSGGQGDSTKPLIDVDFGAGAATTEIGPAATGHSPDDFWNFYTRDGQGGWLSFGVLSNLKTVEGGTTSAGLTVANAPGAWGNGSADPMYNSYIYPFDGQNVTVRVTNLDSGAYDFYVYGLDSSYEVSVDGLSYGSEPLPNGPFTNPVVWQEGLQYVTFRAVQVTNASVITLTVRPGAGGYATLSGMQIAQVDAPPPVARSIVQQPASQSVGEGSDVTFSVGVSGSSPFSYQWRLGGTDISGATGASLTLHQVVAANEGNYSVRVSNPAGSVVSADAALTVTPVNHPPVANSQSVLVAQNGSTAITLSGSDPDGNPLSYVVTSTPAHGTLSGTAPSLNYTPVTDYSGSDSFTFKVNDGQVDSAVATVSVIVLPDGTKPLIDVDFGAGAATTEIGPAATGHSANDFWNFYTRDGQGGWLSFGVLSNLKTVEGGTTSAGLTVANAPGAWGNGSADPMYNSYIYPFDGQNVTVRVTNLDSGAYDFYVYGLDSSYEVSVDGLSYGSEPLPNGPFTNPVVWQEGLQYVTFRAVQVTNASVITLTVRPGAGGYATLSGMQIAQVDAPPPVARSIVQQPASQSVGEGSDVTFSVGVSGSSPFSYQWRLGGTDISGATGASLTLHQVVAANEGNYSVRVSNPAGSVVSADAALTVTPVNHPPVANSQSVLVAQNGSTAITLS